MRSNNLGGAGPAVSAVSVGTSPLAGSPEIYGYDVTPDQAVATIRRVFTSGITSLDTSNEYGAGEGERRIGTALKCDGGLPEDFVMASKADPEAGAKVFDARRVRESFFESIARLGVRRLPIYHLHDPERFDFGAMRAPGGAIEGMVTLKDEGLVDYIGVAGGDIEQMKRYVDTGVFDILLNHSRYTLLDQSATTLIDRARDAGMDYFNAAPYGSGMLAKPATSRPRYQYAPPSDEISETTRWLTEECRRFEVPLAALALQFSTLDTRITTTIVGVSSPDRVDALERNEALDIPKELWASVSSRLEIDEPSDTSGR